MKTLFKDLKVVEIASVLAGPSVGMFFSELGAQVVKIENKRLGGDVTRSWKLPNESHETNVSAYFSAVNYKKSYLFLDLSDEKEHQLVIDLIKRADILIVNFKKGDDFKFGLNYKALRQINPMLIYGAITGFGPESDRVAYDLILQAETGYMSMNGTKDSGPVKMPVALIDVLAGHQLKEGLLIALASRSISEQGSKVEVSLYDAAVAALANQASNWLMANHIAKPIGSLHPNIAPYGEIFITKDLANITFAIGSHKQFCSLVNFLKLKHLAEDKRFSNNSNRVLNRNELRNLIAKRISDFDVEDILKYAHLNFIPVAKIKNIEEVFEAESSKKMILEEEIEKVNTRRVSTIAFKIST